jgi:RNA polymerase sigma-70 factor (ECF subfamily)
MARRASDTGSDQVLVEALRRRDRAALGILYDRYATMLFGLVNRIVRSDDVAEDLLQETFLKAWRSFDTFDPAKGSLATWLAAVARGIAIDRVRSRSYRNSLKNQSIENVVPQVDRERSTMIAADAIGVEGLLRSLTPEQRAIIDLIYYRGFTHDEASRELSMPLGTVKTRLRSAILQLRKEIVDTGEPR